MKNDNRARMKTFVEETKDGTIIVGARYECDDSAGTAARVWTERGWLYIVTDDYEGAAMLHIECLDDLIGALERLRTERTAALSAPKDSSSTLIVESKSLF